MESSNSHSLSLPVLLAKATLSVSGCQPLSALILLENLSVLSHVNAIIGHPLFPLFPADFLLQDPHLVDSPLSRTFLIVFTSGMPRFFEKEVWASIQLVMCPSPLLGM